MRLIRDELELVGHSAELGKRTGLHLLHRPVEDVEETVLVGLHEHLAARSVDGHVGQDELLDRIKVPFLSGRGLEMPCIFPCIRIDGHDR